MSTGHSLLKAFKTIGLILTLGVSMSACAINTFTWKEEVLLHDGRKIVVARSDVYDSDMRHEIGQGAPLAEHQTTFTIPGTNQTVVWKSDNRSFSEPEHLDLLSLDFMGGVPYVATTPSRFFAYQKWGRPNPPYVCFKYVGEWKRITLEEFPAQFRTNVALPLNEQDQEIVFADMRRLGFASVSTVEKLNMAPGRSPERYSIRRTPIDFAPPSPEHKGPKAPYPITPPTTS